MCKRRILDAECKVSFAQAGIDRELFTNSSSIESTPEGEEELANSLRTERRSSCRASMFTDGHCWFRLCIHRRKFLKFKATPSERDSRLAFSNIKRAGGKNITVYVWESVHIYKRETNSRLLGTRSDHFPSEDYFVFFFFFKCLHG